MNMQWVLLCGVAWVLAVRGAVTAVRETKSQTDERMGLTVVAGKVALPREGRWGADPVKDYGGIGQVFLRPGAVAQDQLQGKRARQALAAQAGETHPGHVIAVFRHQRRFHSRLRAQPDHPPSLRAQIARHRQCGKHMASGTACHDHDRARHAITIAFMLAAPDSLGDVSFGITRAAPALAFTEIFELMRAAPA